MKRMRMRTWSHTTMHATRQAWCMVMGTLAIIWYLNEEPAHAIAACPPSAIFFFKNQSI